MQAPVKDDKAIAELRAAAGDALRELGWLAIQVHAKPQGSVDRARIRLRDAIRELDAGPALVDRCGVFGCVRVKGHPSFCCTIPSVAEKVDRA